MACSLRVYFNTAREALISPVNEAYTSAATPWLAIALPAFAVLGVGNFESHTHSSRVNQHLPW